MVEHTNLQRNLCLLHGINNTTAACHVSEDEETVFFCAGVNNLLHVSWQRSSMRGGVDGFFRYSHFTHVELLTSVFSLYLEHLINKIRQFRERNLFEISANGEIGLAKCGLEFQLRIPAITYHLRSSLVNHSFSRCHSIFWFRNHLSN